MFWGLYFVLLLPLLSYDTIHLLICTFILLCHLLFISLFTFDLLLWLRINSKIISSFFNQFVLFFSFFFSFFFGIGLIMINIILNFAKHFLINFDGIVVIIDKVLLWLTKPWLFGYHIDVSCLWVIEALLFFEIWSFDSELVSPC